MATYVVNCADTPFGAALESLFRDVLAPDADRMALAGVAVMKGEDFAARVEADVREARKRWVSQTKRGSSRGKS